MNRERKGNGGDNRWISSYRFQMFISILSQDPLDPIPFSLQSRYLLGHVIKGSSLWTHRSIEQQQVRNPNSWNSTLFTDYSHVGQGLAPLSRCEQKSTEKALKSTSLPEGCHCLLGVQGCRGRASLDCTRLVVGCIGQEQKLLKRRNQGYLRRNKQEKIEEGIKEQKGLVAWKEFAGQCACLVVPRAWSLQYVLSSY